MPRIFVFIRVLREKLFCKVWVWKSLPSEIADFKESVIDFQLLQQQSYLYLMMMRCECGKSIS